MYDLHQCQEQRKREEMYGTCFIIGGSVSHLEQHDHQVLHGLDMCMFNRLIVQTLEDTPYATGQSAPIR